MLVMDVAVIPGRRIARRAALDRFAVLLGAVALGCAAWAVLLPPGMAAVFVAQAVGFAWFAWRFGRAGLWLSADGVVLRGLTRTWRLERGEVAGFAFDAARSACVVERIGRTPLTISALARTGRRHAQAAEHQAIAAELNRVADTVWGGRASPPQLSPREILDGRKRGLRIFLASSVATWWLAVLKDTVLVEHYLLSWFVWGAALTTVGALVADVIVERRWERSLTRDSSGL